MIALQQWQNTFAPNQLPDVIPSDPADPSWLAIIATQNCINTVNATIYFRVAKIVFTSTTRLLEFAYQFGTIALENATLHIHGTSLKLNRPTAIWSLESTVLRTMRTAWTCTSKLPFA